MESPSSLTPFPIKGEEEPNRSSIPPSPLVGEGAGGEGVMPQQKQIKLRDLYRPSY